MTLPSAPSIVQRILARHNDGPIEGIRGDQRLGPDLGLDTVDVVLMGIYIEQAGTGAIAFPIEVLDPEMTVDELEAVYRLWSQLGAEPVIERDEAAGARWALGTPRAARGAGAPPGKAMHVLVAEDDVEMRAIVAASLRADGHRVSEVADGVELLRATSPEALAGAGYDVIVSDIFMPGISGMGALMQLNHESAAPPVVLMTAFGDPALHVWAQQLGAVTTLDKPFDLDEFKALLVKVHVAARRPRPQPSASGP